MHNAKLVLALALVTGSFWGIGCTPNPPVVPSGPEDAKTGYSYTYRLNGRTDEGEVHAQGDIPMDGNATYRATAPAQAQAPAQQKETKKPE